MTRAVEVDPRLHVVPAASLQQALGALPLGLGMRDRCAAVIRLTGAHCVVQAALRRAGAHYRIDYECHGRSRPRAACAGPKSPNSAAASPGRSRKRSSPRTAGRSASNRAIRSPTASMRARSKSANRGDWGSAARMLAVVLDIDPANRAARLQQLRMPTNLQHPSAIEVGERLIETLRAEGDSMTLASAHESQAIALYRLYRPDAAERSAWHIEEALRLAGPQADGDGVARLSLGAVIVVHVAAADPYRAVDCYERAERASQPVPNQVRRAVILGNLAERQAMAGRPLLARPIAEAALRTARLHDLPANIVHALCVLAGIEHSLGLLNAAQVLLSEAVSRLPALAPGEPEAAAWVLLACAKLQADLRGGEPLADVVFPGPEAAARQRTEPRMAMVLGMADGLTALARADAAGTLRPMREATDRAAALGIRNVHHDFLGWLLEATMRCHGAESPQASGLLDKIAAQPAHAADDALHGQVLRAESATLHARGEDAAACRALEATVQATPIGRVNALARIDAAWLHLEAGRDAEARALLRDIGPWLHEHPIGLATLARQKLAQGRLDDARDALRRSLKHGASAGRTRAMVGTTRQRAGGRRSDAAAALAPAVASLTLARRPRRRPGPPVRGGAVR